MAWNGSNGSGEATAVTGKNASKPSARPLLFGALVLVAAVGFLSVLYFFVLREASPSERVVEKKSRRIAENTRQHPSENQQKKGQAQALVKPAIGPGVWLGSTVVSYSAVTNQNTGRILEVIYTEDGRKHKRVVEKSKRPFKNLADEMISIVVSTPLGESMPPMPMYPGFDDDFRKALDEKLVIGDDDPDDVKTLKAQVQLVREEMRERMAHGESPRQILSEHESLWNDNIEMRQKVQKELLNLVRAGDIDGALDYMQVMNNALEKFGIEKVQMPEDYRNMNKSEILKIRKEKEE